MKKNVLIVILVSVWIILAVVFGIYDLEHFEANCKSEFRLGKIS